MYPLFETICVKNGILQNLKWHQLRYEISYKLFYKKTPKSHIAKDIIAPKEYRKGLYKLKISYNEIDKKIKFSKYLTKEIKTLKIVKNDTIDYSLKYSNRDILQHLYTQREQCDDILIIKNNFVTDSSFCNIIFFNGEHWITPSTPLLRGTAREKLLNLGIIKEQKIALDDIKQFQSYKLINALRDFNKITKYDIKNILE